MQCHKEWNEISLEKTFRCQYLASNVWVRRIRYALGCEEFDRRYDAFYDFISPLRPGQFFYTEKAFKRDPWLGHRFLEMYFQMDFLTNLNYDKEKGIVTILAPKHLGLSEWHPINVFKLLRKDPEAWGINKEHIFDV